jgi:ATP-dependent protease ClpP protease subunit
MTNLNSITMVAPKKAEILLYDTIGESFFGGGTSAVSFAEQLSAIGEVDQIDLRINSPGGSVFEGLAIYNALVASKATVSVYVDGLAASIVTVIAMSGDTISMAENAVWMIHEPRAIESGTSEDMMRMASTLETLTNSAVGIYASRTGRDEAEIRTAMKAETWYSAAEAKAAGFIDAITPNKQITASFDAKQFHKAPEWVQKQLTEMTSFKEPEKVTQITQKTEEKPSVPSTVNANEIAMAVTAAIQKATADEAKRQTTITALCAQAKQPTLAAAFCADTSITISDVRDKLFEALCKANGPLGDQGGTASDAEQSHDENDKYRAEFRAEKAYSASMTEAAYIAMRRVDDGLDNLATSLPK